MPRYVWLPSGKKIHLMGRTWHHDRFTACDRRIPADAVIREMDEAIAGEDVCWGCMTEQPWERYAPQRAQSSSYPGEIVAPSPPLPSAPTMQTRAAAPSSRHKPRVCSHVFQAAFDSRYQQCVFCKTVMVSAQ